MKKLGLDLGSSSIGWALRENDKIEKCGVITFQSGMTKGTGGGYSSPTSDRREARSKRRLLQSRRYRKWELLKILLDEFVPLSRAELDVWSKYKKGRARKYPDNDRFRKWLACDFTYNDGIRYTNPYELRVKALDNKLSSHELGRVLYHLVQRRGYKDIGETDQETEKQIERRKQTGFNTYLSENRSLAETLTKEFLNKGKRARNQYPYRHEYEKELLLICEAQQCDSKMIRQLLKAIIWQRPLRGQKGNIGKCTLEPNKPRCPISHPLFEIFRAWSFINTIKYHDESGTREDPSIEHKILLFTNVFLTKDKNFKFEEISKFLNKQLGIKREYNYPKNEKGEYNSSVSGMPLCKGLSDVFDKETILDSLEIIEKYNIGNAPKIYNGYSLYDLWHILFSSDESYLQNFATNTLKIANKKNKNSTDHNPFVKIKRNMPVGYADLSITAISKLLPFLKNGYTYDESAVLAKIPEMLGKAWEIKKEDILKCMVDSKDEYKQLKKLSEIANNLIDKYKGLEPQEIFAYRDYKYTLSESDKEDVEKCCIDFFGERSWQAVEDKDGLLRGVQELYQQFFSNPKRSYIEHRSLTEIFMERLNKIDIKLSGQLYHHSNRKNKFGGPIVDKRTDTEILPESRIDSIKNPMFNKAMSILRKLINELIKNVDIDEDTEIIIEVSRELNDNNKRAAIDRYQREREANRNKYRQFISEFNENNDKSINIDEGISVFEMWMEQTFETMEDENKQKIQNKSNIEILKEKEALKRYELWMEQKGQCMYTGKTISIAQLFSNDIDIAHTIPRSLLPDNTMANMTLCYARYNRDYQKIKTPFYCANFYQDTEIGTAILPRLEKWIELRENWKQRYEKNIRPLGNEDEKKKNKRIQEKHYCKMHYDYWSDKVERFTAKEIKERWVRRQLVDTQIISRYAREFLRTYFKKVAVQKGGVTANFRKIYGFQEQDKIKSRHKHTHHTIDAVVLTLIPSNSSFRDKILRRMYEIYENESRQYTMSPFPKFNSQQLIQNIEECTLVVNYKKDNLLKKTYKNVRKRGKIQYLTNKDRSFVLTADNQKIALKAKGDTMRTTLHAATYLGKIRDVERDDHGRPQRENGDWKYKKGKDEFVFVKREDINKVKADTKNIIDPDIRRLVDSQRNLDMITDHQGNIIRHVRIKAKTGKEVKERLNYRSKYNYKNYFYSEAGSIPYAILFEENETRKIVIVPSSEISKVYRELGVFDIDHYVREYCTDFIKYPNRKLLSIGQRVIILKKDNEYNTKDNTRFQNSRLYVITQFSEGSIWLKYHLASQSKDEIKDSVNQQKSDLLRKYEQPLEIPEVTEDKSITDYAERKKDYENRKYRFDTINSSFRLKILQQKIGPDETKKIKKELDKFKAIPGTLEREHSALLKMSSQNWNFLYEGIDFDISLLGQLTWHND